LRIHRIGLYEPTELDLGSRILSASEIRQAQQKAGIAPIGCAARRIRQEFNGFWIIQRLNQRLRLPNTLTHRDCHAASSQIPTELRALRLLPMGVARLLCLLGLSALKCLVSASLSHPPMGNSTLYKAAA
jgi:hypothetical protein